MLPFTFIPQLSAVLGCQILRLKLFKDTESLVMMSLIEKAYSEGVERKKQTQLTRYFKVVKKCHFSILILILFKMCFQVFCLFDSKSDVSPPLFSEQLHFNFN